MCVRFVKSTEDRHNVCKAKPKKKIKTVKEKEKETIYTLLRTVKQSSESDS
jgi:hypothetical protein